MSKIKLVYWLRNLPWFLTETFICNLFGHKVENDLIFRFRGDNVAPYSINLGEALERFEKELRQKLENWPSNEPLIKEILGDA